MKRYNLALSSYELLSLRKILIEKMYHPLSDIDAMLLEKIITIIKDNQLDKNDTGN